MGYFRIVLHGDGIYVRPEVHETLRLPPNTSGAPIVGFYTTRIVKARDETNAVKAAIEATHEELRSLAFDKLNLGQDLKINAEIVSELNFWQFIRAKPRRGFTFYPEDYDT